MKMYYGLIKMMLLISCLYHLSRIIIPVIESLGGISASIYLILSLMSAYMLISVDHIKQFLE